MKATTMGRLAVKHIRNAVAENVYLQSGYDRTKPTMFYGFVNERCNVKCRYCEFWRLPTYREEMSIAEWQKALLSIKEFVGEFSISFSGGEPFLKRDFISLLEFCRDSQIHSGVTTNGSALNQRNAERVVLAEPFNVNISCDAPDRELNDYLRGSTGLFDRVAEGVFYLRQFQRAHGIDFPILIKPTVSVLNFKLLPDMVRWAERIGATAVNMQPLDRWTRETYEELWIEEENLLQLEAVVEDLVSMKQAGARIMNTEEAMRLMIPHFLEQSAPLETMPCRVGMRDFFVRPNGSVEVCWSYPTIGNIKDQTAREIWYGERANEVRKQTVECRRLCLQTCMSHKRIRDKVKMGITLLRK